MRYDNRRQYVKHLLRNCRLTHDHVFFVSPRASVDETGCTCTADKGAADMTSSPETAKEWLHSGLKPEREFAGFLRWSQRNSGGEDATQEKPEPLCFYARML